MNTLVLPAMEENDNETEKRKIGEIAITMPEQEQIEDLRTECSKLLIDCNKKEKKLTVNNKIANISSIIWLIGVICAYIFAIRAVVSARSPEALINNNILSATTIILIFSYIANIIYAGIIQDHSEKHLKTMDLLEKKKALLALYDALYNMTELQIHVFDETDTDGLYLFDVSTFDKNGDMTDETDTLLDKKYPDGCPTVGIKYIETKKRDEQATLSFDLEDNNVIFTAPIDYRMFLKEDSRLMVLA